MRNYPQYYSQWIFTELKDKEGKQPTKEIWDFIQKLERDSLLPCPRTASELEMPVAQTTPREMNSFIIFRRQLAHVAKQRKSSEDGRVLSRAASFIWNSASKEEKDSYVKVAKELKKRHYERYPNYSYERKKRSSNEGGYIFVPHDATNTTNQISSKRPKKSVPQTCGESSHIQQEYAPSSTLLQDKGNGENMLDLQNLFTYNHPSVDPVQQEYAPPSSTSLQQDKGNEENIINFQNLFTYDAHLPVDPVLYCDNNNYVNDNECFSLSDEVIPQLYLILLIPFSKEMLTLV